MKKTVFALLALILALVGLTQLSSKVSPVRTSVTVAGAESASGNGSRG